MTDHLTTKILTVRHGQTDWNVLGKMQGQLDIPLNAQGHEQAQLTAKALAQLECAAIYSSDLSRAKATAQAIADHKQMQLFINTGLRERHFGSYQGFTFEEVRQHSPEDAKRWQARDLDFFPGGNGESLNAFSNRVISAVHAIARQHIGQTLVIVTHGGVLDALYREATQTDLQAPRTWQLGNASIGTLLWSQNQLRLQSWGDAAHLGGESLESHGEPTDTGPKGTYPL